MSHSVSFFCFTCVICNANENYCHLLVAYLLLVIVFQVSCVWTWNKQNIARFDDIPMFYTAISRIDVIIYHNAHCIKRNNPQISGRCPNFISSVESRMREAVEWVTPVCFHSVAVLRWGQGGTGTPNLSQPPLQIFGHSSSATGWINWFYSKFRLAVVASQMMRGQAPQIFFPRTATAFTWRMRWWRRQNFTPKLRLTCWGPIATGSGHTR